MWVCIFHDGRSLSRTPAHQINKFLYSGLERIKVIHLSLRQISTDQELREPWEAFVSIPRSPLHWYSSVQLFPFNICAGGGQASSQFKQCMTVWEPPPTHPTATGAWSEFKGGCCDPQCQHQPCLQTDVSTAREGKEGNNPPQATRCLNIVNLKLPATAREESSCSNHHSTTRWCHHCWVCHCPFPCRSPLIHSHQLTKHCQFPGQRSDGR